MKRKMSFSQRNDNSNISLSSALTILGKRNKGDHVALVGNNEALAEKVEPGYLIKLAEGIERANDFVFHNACGKLKIIEEQMNNLKKQAYQILVDAKINSKIHSLPCNFPKKSHHVYSVYEKPTGECYLSMLTVEEWGQSCPHNFIGSYKLEGDMTWTPIDEYSSTSAFRKWISPSNDDITMIE